ncbi:helix-turn-helix domain-containing protein [Micromonospora sp. DT46]|uniref:helix-turn-helix domain-containing protein n=1 Tax=unclassified Micromonospora TaxID=2617518 RepID=UPI00124B6F1D|nr:MULTISPECIES: helix-turn-helix transcriptional regulator [unclassified Micromonospora]KAB1138797.1 helix-turn-helix domain-containing protein [Micromonospora sp. AMSO12t]WSG00274.1 helix-turn-helix domain-containing protein [Micromonospora sp. NBC_01740]
MTEDVGSTVPRRQLGRLLRQYRTEAGVTLDAAAEALEYSRQKIWRIECGMGPVRVLDVKAMCELYGVSAEMTEAMRGLATETKSKGWWHAYGDAVPSWFELYVGLESAAARLRGYDESLIPGILQTRDYAQALFRLGRILSDEERERAVEVRLQRQALLTRRLPAAPRLESVLSEPVLRRTVGGSAVMTAQLDHLLRLSELPNVSVRVLPLAAGPQPGAVAGTFMILDFPPAKGGRAAPEPSVVYSESLTGALYLDKPDELSAYERVWRGLDALALGETDSMDMIKTIIGEMRHD